MEKKARKGLVDLKGEWENVLRYNKSAGIKLAQTEGKEIDTALAFIWFMMAVNPSIASIYKAWNLLRLPVLIGNLNTILSLKGLFLSNEGFFLYPSTVGEVWPTRQPKTNLVWQIYFKIYPNTSEAPQKRWQIAEGWAVFLLQPLINLGREKITRAIQYFLFPLLPISISGLMLAPWASEWNPDSQYDLNMMHVFCLPLTESHVLILNNRKSRQRKTNVKRNL